ncbi:MAG: hypothetical protein HY706_22000 [Candidatus Hydrogenedentes bacterium]|nr:hypothetical protein [Candidatus Hydrogenedentota bacterium]
MDAAAEGMTVRMNTIADADASHYEHDAVKCVLANLHKLRAVADWNPMMARVLYAYAGVSQRYG